jgi:hypothetical protein
MSKAAFFQVLYQNDTLFRLNPVASEPIAPVQNFVPEQKKPAQPAPVPTPVQKVAETLPEQPKLLPVPETTPFPSLQHRILILFDEPKQKEIVISEGILLENILKAVGHTTEKADLLNFSFLPGQDARQVFADKKTNFFITFGVPLIKLHLDFLLVPYTPKLVDGIWFLMADPLAVVEADRNTKKKLWLALQKMFEMS